MWRTSILVAFVAACSPGSDSDSVDVIVEGGPDAMTRLAAGRRWIDVGNDALAVHEGRATVARSVGALVAFVDADGNGHLDPVAEDSTPCLWDQERWRCVVEPLQVTVLRVVTDDGMRTFVLPRLDRDPSSLYCVGNPTRCDGEWAVRPRSVDERALSTCEERVALWMEPLAPQRLTLGARKPIAATVTAMALSDGAIDVRIESDVSLDRLRVWVGSDDAPQWDSETSAEPWRQIDRGSVIAIPAAIRRTCASCTVNVAVADQARRRDEQSHALVLDVRERRFQIMMETQ